MAHQARHIPNQKLCIQPNRYVDGTPTAHRRLKSPPYSYGTSSTHPTKVTHRSQSWSWMINSHPFRSMSISPLHSEISGIHCTYLRILLDTGSWRHWWDEWDGIAWCQRTRRRTHCRNAGWTHTPRNSSRVLSHTGCHQKVTPGNNDTLATKKWQQEMILILDYTPGAHFTNID